MFSLWGSDTIPGSYLVSCQSYLSPSLNTFASYEMGVGLTELLRWMSGFGGYSKGRQPAAHDPSLAPSGPGTAT